MAIKCELKPFWGLWLRSGDDPFWLVLARRLASYADFEKIIIVGSEAEIKHMKHFAPEFCYATGGATRQESLKNALALVDTPFVMSTDAARLGVSSELVNRLIKSKEKADCIVPVLKCADSIIFNGSHANRDELGLFTTLTHSHKSPVESAPFNFGSLSGKNSPISPRAAAPKSASHKLSV